MDEDYDIFMRFLNEVIKKRHSFVINNIYEFMNENIPLFQFLIVSLPPHLWNFQVSYVEYSPSLSDNKKKKKDQIRLD